MTWEVSNGIKDRFGTCIPEYSSIIDKEYSPGTTNEICVDDFITVRGSEADSVIISFYVLQVLVIFRLHSVFFRENDTSTTTSPNETPSAHNANRLGNGCCYRRFGHSSTSHFRHRCKSSEQDVGLGEKADLAIRHIL